MAIVPGSGIGVQVVPTKVQRPPMRGCLRSLNPQLPPAGAFSKILMSVMTSLLMASKLRLRLSELGPEGINASTAGQVGVAA